MNQTGEKRSKEKRILGLNINNSFIGALLMMVVGLVTATALLIVAFKPSPTITPKTYDECSRLRSSVIEDSYPETCVSEGGFRFVNPNQPEIEVPDEQTTWQSYTNERFTYQILHPTSWILKQSRPANLTTATFQHSVPARDGSEVEVVAAEIIVKGITRTSSDRDRDLKQVIIARADNFFFSFLDPGKITQLMVEENLNTMTPLTISGYNALLGEEIAYIDTEAAIIQFTLTSPLNNLTDNDRTLFKQVVLTFESDQAMSPTPTSILATDPATICRNNNGTWLPEYDECEGLDKNFCEGGNGQYDSCESPCRHDPNTEACITLCVEVCTF